MYVYKCIHFLLLVSAKGSGLVPFGVNSVAFSSEDILFSGSIPGSTISDLSGSGTFGNLIFSKETLDNTGSKSFLKACIIGCTNLYPTGILSSFLILPTVSNTPCIFSVSLMTNDSISVTIFSRLLRIVGIPCIEAFSSLNWAKLAVAASFSSLITVLVKASLRSLAFFCLGSLFSCIPTFLALLLAVIAPPLVQTSLNLPDLISYLRVAGIPLGTNVLSNLDLTWVRTALASLASHLFLGAFLALAAINALKSFCAFSVPEGSLRS